MAAVRTARAIGGQVFVIIDPAAIAAMARSPQGPVVRDLFVRGEKVKQAAIREAPGKGKPGPNTKPWTTGANNTNNLKQHIVKRLVTGPKGTPQMLVGVENVPYARYVHNGTSQHVIRASRAPFLVFFWEKIGEVVAFKQVTHPGNKPNPFLIRALPAGGGASVQA
jgi:hypothetical protein